MSLYELLGVEADATEKEIGDAYRRKSAAAHPDLGGTKEQMDGLARAYEILKDPDRRRRYDEIGDTSSPSDLSKMVEQRVTHLFEKGLSYGDPFTFITQTAKDGIAGIRRQIPDKQAALTRKEFQLNRFVRQNTPIDTQQKRYVHDLFKARVRAVKKEIADYELEIEVALATIEYVTGMFFEDEEPGPRPEPKKYLIPELR